MTPQKNDKKLFVSLGCEIDCSRFSQFSNNQKFHELKKPNGLIYYEIQNLSEAKILTQKFISEFDLGGSNWTGGRVIDQDNNFIARISYNGRVWDSEEYPCKEIEL